MPFDGMVSNNPKMDEMKQLVSHDKKRPPIPSKWNNDEVLCLLYVCVYENMCE